MISSAAKLGHVSEDGIRQLVDAFYDKVRLDAELAPIFLRAIPGDWEPHLTRMYAFWSSVMLTTGRYKGNPVVKHLVIPGIQPHLFERWLALFNETCGELFDDEACVVLSSGPPVATGGNAMTFVVTENCIKCKYMDCVEVCPVDCFYEGDNMLVIHPDECIDCGVCEPECPAEAISPDTQPGLESWLKLNAEYASVWPNITIKREAPADAKSFDGVPNKLQEHFSANPGQGD